MADTVLKDEHEPTPAERLALELVELQMDVEELRNRLDGRNEPRDMEHKRRLRAARWERVLAVVQAAVGEKR